MTRSTLKISTLVLSATVLCACESLSLVGGQDFKVLGPAEDLSHEQAIQWLRTNGEYQVSLEKGDLIQGIEALGAQLGFKVKVDVIGQERPVRIHNDYANITYQIPECVSWTLDEKYQIGTNSYVETLNKIVSPYDLAVTLFANDVLLISSSKAYPKDFCTTSYLDQ